MFRAIGYILLLYAVVNIFGSAITSFEKALVATFDTIESAALVSKSQIEQI